MANRIARSRGPFVRGGGPRRETQWISLGPSEVTIASVSTAVLAFSLNAAALALRPFTIVRTRLDWICESDQNATSEQYGASLGMAVVSDQASAIGVTAVPTPVTDLDSDLFFVFDQIFGSFVHATSVGFQDLGQGAMKSIDSKAMRKVNADQDVILTLETASFQSSAAMTIGGRQLIKLH